MKKIALALLAIFLFQNYSYSQAKVSDKDVEDAYMYFIGRLFVLRQEHIDFKDNGYAWNKLFHREVGKVSWANPNLDVAYSEAWLAIDNNSCAIVDIPEIKNRYYTFQVLNSWGETVSNINERTFPQHPHGKFAYCSKNSTVKLADGIQKIPLEGNKFRVLARIELGADAQEAVKLQKQMNVTMQGEPQIAKAVDIPIFDNKTLIGVEGFDNADAILVSEPDINPGMKPLQEKVKAVSAAAKNPEQRRIVENTIRNKAIPGFFKELKEGGIRKNGWMRPHRIGNYGTHYKDRSLIDLAGIWANNNKEAIYYVAHQGSDKKDLTGNNVYTITFPKNEMPQSIVQYFWSVIAVDAVDFHVISNPQQKYVINNQTKLKPNPDGSVTIVLASEQPIGFDQANWIPTAKDKNFTLTFRLYGPKKDSYFPPPVTKVDRSMQAEEEKPKN